MQVDSAVHDHRPRVAAERRARMRRKLVESALLVFAERGVDATVIEDVIAAAGVSRGTFYNYFRTNADLLHAIAEELGNDLVERIEARVCELPSPAARLFTGLRLYQDVARRFPLFARFVARVGPRGAGTPNLVYAYLPVNIAEGVASGELIASPILVSLDVVVGVMLIALERIATGQADLGYLRALLLALARALGMAAPRAEALLDAPLTPIDFDEESLLVRSDARSRQELSAK